jgi:AraC-like DNA-binding protein
MAFEPDGFEHVVMVGWQSSEQAEYAVCPHFHPGIIELHLVVRGQVSYLIDGHYHTMCGGDILLIQPGSPHGTVEEPLGRCERYWLQLRVPPDRSSALGLPPEATQQVFDGLRQVPTRPFHTDNSLVPVFERIRGVFADKQDPLRLINLQNLVLRAILDCLTLANGSASNPESAGIEASLRLIQQSQGPVSLAELARASGMSESSFKIHFKKQTGHTPVEYATRHRIETARRLLNATDRQITDIAHELGFSSSQHFATVFGRYTGQTPNEFRNGASAEQWNMKPMAGAGASFSPLLRLRKTGKA